MIETKDPAIKLFGKTIPLPADGDDSLTASGTADSCEVMDCDYATTTTCSDEEKKGSRVEEEEEEEEEEETEKDILAVKSTEAKQLDDGDESEKAEILLETNDNPKTPSIDEETAMIKTSKTGKEQSDKANSQEKPLKKPDKILPCPRCNSMDTKFCYYNNYNINQPRHFCKACQRYWTAGGTMRNVPVGAGRRKNKNSASQYRHITISEALQAARIEAPNGVHHALKSNGTVLNFGSDSCLSESIASVLNLTDKKPFWNGTPNGYHKIEEQRIPVPCRVGESGDDHSSGSSVTALNSMEEGNRTCAQEPMMSNFHGFPSQIPFLPSVPWPYPWNSAIPPPAFCHPGFPMPFYPPSYWNCTIPNTWNVPWLSSQSSPNQKSQSSSSNSSTLGKHPRDENMLIADNQEEEGLPKQKSADRCIWVPKTLRIDDPDEAAKSSIWATLGIKNDSIKGKGLFKAFQSKGDEKNHVSENSAVLRANPAALSRSLNFHENS